jgi:hypothetical protein
MKMRKPNLVAVPTQVKRASSRSSQLPADDVITKVTERGRKSRRRLRGGERWPTDGRVGGKRESLGNVD